MKTKVSTQFYLCLSFFITTISLNAQGVGVGTLLPAARLHVKSNSTVTIPQLLLEEDENDYSRLTFMNTNTTKYWSAAAIPAAVDSQSFFNIYNSSTGNLLILNGKGKLGIATTPAYPLSFNDNLGDKIALYGGSSYGPHYGFGIQPFLLQIHTSNSSDDVAFGYGSSGAFTETMRIKGNGKVGIGTNTPDTRLHVFGGSSGMDPNINSIAAFENTGSTYINVLSNGETGLLFGANGIASDGGIVYNNSSLLNGLLFRTNNNVNRLSISDDGKVGINITPPQYTLDIKQPAGVNLVTNIPVMNVAYTGTNLSDVIGIKSKCKPGDYFGIGGSFEGGYVAIDGKVEGNANGNYYGLRSISNGAGSGYHYGVSGSATAASGFNFGVYGYALQGSTNWSGYFEGGNVYIGTRLGIGVSIPAYNLDINDDQAVARLTTTTSANGAVLVLRSEATSQSFVGSLNFDDNGSTSAQVALDNNGVLQLRTSSIERLNVTSGGLIGINRIPATNRLEVLGAASKTTAGEWLGNSDARLKKNIQALNPEEMIGKLLSLQGINYEWNDDKTGDERPEGIQYGFTAQNIQDVFPTLVEEDAKGYLQTAYGTYDAMMVEAIRFLFNENKMLREEIEVIKAAINSKQ